MKNRAKRIIAIGLLLSTVFTCSIPVYAGKEYFAFTTNAVDKRRRRGKRVIWNKQHMLPRHIILLINP